MDTRSYKDLIELPDYLTMGNALCGLGSMLLSISGNYYESLLLLLVAVCFDRTDGVVARAINRKEKVFGDMLDALSDTISFVIAPAILGFCLGLTSWWSVTILLGFMMSGVLRLARFETVKTQLGYFQGMPTPYSAFIFSILYFLLDLFKVGHDLTVILFSLTFLVSAILMSSSLKWKKL